jgi:hypothetical protein
MIFPTRAPSLFPGLGLRMPRVPVTIQTQYFFDRAAVKNALGNLKHEGCWRSSILVRRTAAKSIRKVGAARPRLKIMAANPNVPIAALLKTPGLRQSTQRALQIRMAEIQNRPPSPPGTPPHTHVPSTHMLGFRRNLYNAMDPSLTSAVVGPSAKGKDPLIANLHEFGGRRTLIEYYFQPTRAQRQAWHNKKLRYVQMLSKWATPHEPPGGQFVPTGRTKVAQYPARPFMLPALDKSRPKIAQMFAGKFSATRRGL